MAIERAASSSSLVDVIDRVLDKGIVIDAWAQVSVAGLEVITIDARVVVASLATYLKLSPSLAAARRASPPALPDLAPAWLAEHLEPGEAAPRVLWSA